MDCGCVVKLWVLAVVSLATFSNVECLDNGLARTPQMGYNSWYDLMCHLEYQELIDTVDKMVELGLPELGYKYFNLDDCWATDRHPNGTLIADPKIFPGSTLKSLADYVHSKGMLFGTYTDRGDKTCGGRPAALDHEVLDANTYASWGVDYLKEDSCNAPTNHTQAFEEYGRMTKALNATGRPILFSLCGWNPWYAPVGYSLGNSWRIGPDDTNYEGVLANIDINSQLAQYAGPGGWNDPCLLLGETATGTLRMTPQQTRMQFSMWAIMASPLLISANLRNMSQENIETFTNKEVIAVNQDPLGKQGFRVVGGDLRPSSSVGGIAVVPCNASDPAQRFSLNSPASEYIQSVASQKCLNIDNCGTNVIMYDCVQSGGTCCGKDCYDNMKFTYDNDQITSPFGTQPNCLTNQGDTLNMAPCSQSSDSQYWTYNTTTKQIIAGRSGTGCVTIDSNSGDRTNVWARELQNGAWAMVFVNAGVSSASITCDASCFTKLGFQPNVQLQARDLWLHKSLSISTNGFRVTLDPAGGSAMYLLNSTTTVEA